MKASAIKVYAGAQAAGEPLLRYEYAWSTSGDIPGAHIQTHGHRDALTFLMTRSGTAHAVAADLRVSPG